MGFRLVPNSVTLHDLERSRESSCSLSHLLMSFLFYLVMHTTIIYKVLCIYHILHAIQYSYTFTDVKFQ